MEINMKFELGMTSVTFREKTIEEIASLAKTAGLSVIEWGGDRHVLPLDFEAVKIARTEMEKNGIFLTKFVVPSMGSMTQTNPFSPSR